MLKEARNEQKKINSEISMRLKLQTWKSSRSPQTEKVPDWSLTGMLLTLWVITQCHGGGGTACWEKQQRAINHRSRALLPSAANWWRFPLPSRSFLCWLLKLPVSAALWSILAWSPRGASVTKRFEFPGDERTWKAHRVRTATETLGELPKYGAKELM